MKNDKLYTDTCINIFIWILIQYRNTCGFIQQQIPLILWFKKTQKLATTVV